MYFGAGGYGDTFEDGRVFDLNQATPEVYYNLLWATREHSFDVSLWHIFDVLFEGRWEQSHAMGLTYPVPVQQLVSVDWKESDWVYPQVAGKNNWFGSLQFYDALNGTSCLSIIPVSAHCSTCGCFYSKGTMLECHLPRKNYT